MAIAAALVARELLSRDRDSLETLEVRPFAREVDAHDDRFQQALTEEFESKFETVKIGLIQEYGQPSRTGDAKDKNIPLNGVIRFAVWEFGSKSLFLAAAHEDRECPFVMMMGTRILPLARD